MEILPKERSDSEKLADSILEKHAEVIGLNQRMVTFSAYEWEHLRSLARKVKRDETFTSENPMNEIERRR